MQTTPKFQIFYNIFLKVSFTWINGAMFWLLLSVPIISKVLLAIVDGGSITDKRDVTLRRRASSPTHTCTARRMARSDRQHVYIASNRHATIIGRAAKKVGPNDPSPFKKTARIRKLNAILPQIAIAHALDICKKTAALGRRRYLVKWKFKNEGKQNQKNNIIIIFKIDLII